MDGLPFAVIVILGIVQGVLLSLILWINKKGNQTANRLLSLLILLMVWHHLQNISIFLNFYSTFPHFFGADHGSLFLFGPLFYFYTLKVTHPSFTFKRLHLLHFLPFVLVTIYDPVLFLGTEAKVEAITLWLSTMRYDKPELASRFFISNVLFFMQFVHVMFYVAWSTKRHHALQQNKSALHQIHWKWLRKLTIGFGLVLLVSFLFQRLLYIVIHYYSYSFDYVYIVPMTLFIYAIGFVAMRQPEVYYGTVDGRTSKKKYESSSLNQKENAMRSVVLCAMVLLGIVPVVNLQAQSQPTHGALYTLDKQHSLLDFTARHIGFGRVRGTFKQYRAAAFLVPRTSNEPPLRPPLRSLR